MTSLTGRLAGEGTGQNIEYKEKLVNNAQAVTQNAIVSITSKVKDNVLCMMVALVIAL